MRIGAFAATAALLISSLHPAAADVSALFGRWNYLLRTPDGRGYATWFEQFGQNGDYYIAFPYSGSPNGLVTYFGRYSASSDAYTFTIFDFSPRQLCSTVCLPITPVLPIGAPITCGYEGGNPSVFLTVDCRNGDGPTQWKKVF
jgi:hypothetical protein